MLLQLFILLLLLHVTDHSSHRSIIERVIATKGIRLPIKYLQISEFEDQSLI